MVSVGHRLTPESQTPVLTTRWTQTRLVLHYGSALGNLQK